MSYGMSIWKMLGLSCLIMLWACSSRVPVAEDSPEVDLENMTYLSGWFPSGQVKLTNGSYRQRVAPGSATETAVKLAEQRAFGTVGGHKTAAVILVTDPGGSGTFYDLGLVVKRHDRWANIDLVTLGDRIKIHAIAIKDNVLVLDMTTHGPGDTMSFPTQRSTQSFILLGDRLARAPNKNLSTAGQIMIGPVWKWVQTLYNNDTKVIPQDPEHYTLQLGQDGKVAIRADCNRGGGTYEANGSQVSIQITHTTRAACPSGSLENQFIKDLNAAVIYFTRGGFLYIDLKYDTGTMKFNR